MTTTKHIIDTDTQPFIPEGWSIVRHRQGGKLELNLEEILHYLSEAQKSGKSTNGHDLRKELSEEKVLNACVLDYLLSHSLQVPKEWKWKGPIFFWGTQYRNERGFSHVRYLEFRSHGIAICLHAGEWRWGSRQLDDDWGPSDMAAVLAS